MKFAYCAKTFTPVWTWIQHSSSVWNLNMSGVPTNVFTVDVMGLLQEAWPLHATHICCEKAAGTLYRHKLKKQVSKSNWISGERKLASCLWGGCWPTHVTHWSLHLEDWEQRSSFATWLQNLLVLHPPHMTLLVTTIYNPFLDRNVFCLTGIMMSACKNLSTHFWWLDFKSEWLKCRQVSLTTSTTTWLAWFCLLATQKCLAWSWHACGLRHWNMATSNLTNWAKGQNPRMQRKYLVMLALNIQLLQGMYCSIWVLSEHGFNDI